jgi:hypothetical protein
VLYYYDQTEELLKQINCLDKFCEKRSPEKIIDSRKKAGSMYEVRIVREGTLLLYLDVKSSLLVYQLNGEKTTLSSATGDIAIAIGYDGLPIISYRNASGFYIKKCLEITCQSSITTNHPLFFNSTKIKIWSFKIFPLVSFVDDKGVLTIYTCKNMECSK